MTDPQDRDVETELGDAISGILGRRREVVTRWAAVVEIITSEGEPARRILAQPQAAHWDTMDLFHYGERVESADLGNAIRRDDD